MNTLESRDLLSRLKDTRLSAFVRRCSSGKVLVLSGIYVPKDVHQEDFCQFLLTEAIAAALGQGCTYAYLIAQTLSGAMSVADFTLYAGAATGFASLKLVPNPP